MSTFSQRYVRSFRKNRHFYVPSKAAALSEKCIRHNAICFSRSMNC